MEGGRLIDGRLIEVGHYFQEKVERSFNNNSLQQRKCWQFQVNKTAKK